MNVQFAHPFWPGVVPPLHSFCTRVHTLPCGQVFKVRGPSIVTLRRVGKGSIHKHWGLCDRWCEPDYLWMTLGWEATSTKGVPGVPPLKNSQYLVRSNFLWEMWQGPWQLRVWFCHFLSHSWDSAHCSPFLPSFLLSELVPTPPTHSQSHTVHPAGPHCTLLTFLENTTLHLPGLKAPLQPSSITHKRKTFFSWIQVFSHRKKNYSSEPNLVKFPVKQ